MDYSNGIQRAGQPKLGSSANPGKPLERLSLAVQRITAANVRIGGFFDRFHGAGQLVDCESADPVNNVPYGIEMERLFDAIDRLQTRVDALELIG